MKRTAKLIAVALLMSLSAGCSGGPLGGAEAVTAEHIPLSVRTAQGERKFSIEIARTPDEQARGLMFREALPKNGGMIFPMIPPRHASFWMKNTLIPLDMIFIRSDGTIARIEPETVPHSLVPVQSGEPVAAVLEIDGGLSAKLGIAEGDQVIWADPKG